MADASPNQRPIREAVQTLLPNLRDAQETLRDTTVIGAAGATRAEPLQDRETARTRWPKDDHEIRQAGAARRGWRGRGAAGAGCRMIDDPTVPERASHFRAKADAWRLDASESADADQRALSRDRAEGFERLANNRERPQVSQDKPGAWATRCVGISTSSASSTKGRSGGTSRKRMNALLTA